MHTLPIIIAGNSRDPDCTDSELLGCCIGGVLNEIDRSGHAFSGVFFIDQERAQLLQGTKEKRELHRHLVAILLESENHRA